ncbi:hypothetical protein [Streptomyces sp. NPDC017991]|uniref:hypothetical protein n=1 Tax=Streptomyces sp. NPDC017991 TaxID=3365026 RepID=UPI0037BAD897
MNRIYIQNGARKSHGVADPGLGLAAWRSAVILNSLLDKEYYCLGGDDITLSFLQSLDQKARIGPPSSSLASNTHTTEKGS